MGKNSAITKKVQARARVKMYETAIRDYSNHPNDKKYHTHLGVSFYLKKRFNIDSLEVSLPEFKDNRLARRYRWKVGDASPIIKYLKKSTEVAQRCADYTKMIGKLKTGWVANIDKEVSVGLCYLTMEIFGHKLRDVFKEINLLKPDSVFGHWWPKTDRDIRIKILKEAISIAENRNVML